MNKAILLRKAKKALPYILSGLSIAGVVATAIFSAKATAKALEHVEERDDTWKCYIPTALTAIATALCIIGNGILNKKQQASLVAAYTLLASNYKKYREKTKEICGEETDQKIICSIDVEEPKKEIIFNPGVVLPASLDWGIDEEETQHLFYEAFGKRYFTSTADKVRLAEMMMCNNLYSNGWVSINDFYRYLGLETVTGGDEIGWCVCDGCFIEFDHYKSKLEDAPDGLEALVIDYIWIPEPEASYNL